MANRKSAAHRWDLVVERILGAACRAHGLSVDYDLLGVAAGSSGKTIRRRMETPGELSLDELYGMAQSLGLILTVKLEKPEEKENGRAEKESV